MNRCRWFWLASSFRVGTLALSLMVPIVAQAAQPTSPVQHSPTQIFQRTGIAEEQSGNTVTFPFDVPPGKVLVVESISARVIVPPGQIVTAQVNCNGSSLSDFDFASKFLVFQRITLGTHERFVADQLTRCYVLTGSFTAVVQRNVVDGNFNSVDVSISGYLIDK